MAKGGYVCNINEAYKVILFCILLKGESMKLLSLKKSLMFLGLSLFVAQAIAKDKNDKMLKKNHEVSKDAEQEMRVGPLDTVVNNNLYVANTVYTNEIDPVKFTANGVPTADQTGITTFSGNVGFRPNKKLLVNEINPVASKTVVDASGKQHVVAVENDNGVTCFSGNVGVNPAKELWVNKINPVRTVNGVCAPDDRCGAKTHFSAGIAVRKSITWDCIDPINITNRGVYPIKLRFNNLGLSPIEGAFLRFYFIGKSGAQENDYDVFFCQSIYVGKTCACSTSDSSLLSCTNPEALYYNPIQWSVHVPEQSDPSFFDVYLNLYISSENSELSYYGCFCYELINCDSLHSVECNPNPTIELETISCPNLG